LSSPRETPKITVYIPAYNYGKYIEQAIESVLNQTMDDWELIVINDGSTDNTSEILKKYEGHPKIRIIEQDNRGLTVSNNIALRLSNGKYLMRLDADDYLEENALLVLSNILDNKLDFGLVYPDYYIVDEDGEILEVVRRKKIGEEVELLDLPAHGACTMFRKECMVRVRGYEESIDRQDGYDIWLKFNRLFQPTNVNVPLFYYRQHAGNLTKDQQKLLRTRKAIKRDFVKKHVDKGIPRVLGIIPVLKKTVTYPYTPFAELAGKPLIWYTINEALQTKMLDKIVVTSDDDEVLDYTKGFAGIVTIQRPPELAKASSTVQSTVLHSLDILKEKDNYSPNAVMILYVNAPLRKATHIEEAINTLVIFDVDSVVSVCEELAHYYTHDRTGLAPLWSKEGLRIERESIYKQNGAILLSKVDAITEKDFLGKRIGHIVMLPEESIKITNKFEFWLAEKIISEWDGVDTEV
jgi:CMP-N-acetylneuraminic acid synthetase